MFQNLFGPRALAYYGLAGTILGGIGGLYVAYELLGGRDGPLGHATRAATYGLLFGIGYGLPFGPFFGFVNGVGLGMLLSLEFHRVRRHQERFGSSPLLQSPLFGVTRGFLFGVACLPRFGWHFGLTFGLLSGLGLFAVYAMRFAPTNDYISQSHIVLSRHRLMASLWRGTAIGLSGAMAGALTGGSLVSAGFGLTIGLTVACVSIVVTTLSPRVEWWIEHLPDRHLGILGVAMILIALAFQSIPSLVTLFAPSLDSPQTSSQARAARPSIPKS